MHITIEGPDGSGKSTVAARLAKDFGRNCLFVREPGGTPYGEALRGVLKNNKLRPNTLAYFYTFAAGHVQLKAEIERWWKQNYSKGMENLLIVQDRHAGVSAYAYQVKLGGLPYAKWLNLYSSEYIGTNLIIVMNASVDTILSRINKRGGKKNADFEQRDKLKEIVNGYKEFAGLKPNPLTPCSRDVTYMKDDVVVINANCDKDTLYKRVLRAIIKHGLNDEHHLYDVARTKIKQLEKREK